jgi:hypothetical protein
MSFTLCPSLIKVFIKKCFSLSRTILPQFCINACAYVAFFAIFETRPDLLTSVMLASAPNPLILPLKSFSLTLVPVVEPSRSQSESHELCLMHQTESNANLTYHTTRLSQENEFVTAEDSYLLYVVRRIKTSSLKYSSRFQCITTGAWHLRPLFV